MTFQLPYFSRFAAAFLVFVLVLGDAHIASAQSTRYWNREVAAGKQIEFQWTNYDGATCRDNGYAKFSVVKKPSLGKFRVVKKRVTQQDGQCKGKRFSTLLISYVAGSKKGTDNTAFAVTGGSRIDINLKIKVR